MYWRVTVWETFYGRIETYVIEAPDWENDKLYAVLAETHPKWEIKSLEKINDDRQVEKLTASGV